jgi:hypothetical protein
LTRGEIYRTSDRLPERGDKPGYYVVVSRAFIAENDDVTTVVCAPVYSNVLGLSTFVGSLATPKLRELDRALSIALDLPPVA